MYKVSNVLSPPVVSNIFTQKIVTVTICDLIFSFPDLLLALHFTGSKVYSTLVQSPGTFFLIVAKKLPNFSVFKNRIKKWKPAICPCRLCKTFVYRVDLTGFRSSNFDKTFTQLSLQM